MAIFVYEVTTNDTIQVDKGLRMYQLDLHEFNVGWSPDSRWLAYARGQDNRLRALYLFDTNSEARHQVTAGYYDDSKPVFDPDGKYLYFLSRRTFTPSYSDLDNSFIYANTTKVMAVSLRPDIPSPVAPRNDEDEFEGNENEKGESEDEEAQPVEIVIDGFEQRAVALPPQTGNYHTLDAAPGRVLYWKLPFTDSYGGLFRLSGGPEAKSALVFYDVEERKEEIVLEDIDGYRLSADHQKIMVWKERDFYIVDFEEDQRMEKKLRTAELEMLLDPKAEWKQIFNDSWRLNRDFFYDEGMHGVDWEAMRERYATLLPDVITRWDLNYVMGELVAELNSSHAYSGGGDLSSEQRIWSAAHPSPPTLRISKHPRRWMSAIWALIGKFTKALTGFRKSSTVPIGIARFGHPWFYRA